MQNCDHQNGAEVDSDNIGQHDRGADKNEIGVFFRGADAQHDDRWNQRDANRRCRDLPSRWRALIQAAGTFAIGFLAANAAAVVVGLFHATDFGRRSLI
jgi:hypothetical protein